ncbi:alpha/beta hydrolase [Mycolicibacterium cosmeticum]|uniref:alpha/beta fold hydrolase n=1 Tax=Mycolicibacterium cosmeticum TaxID=258533 RepID=UPI003204A83E
MSAPERRANLIELLQDQPSTLEWLPRERAHLREYRPPTLIAWGPHDGYMPEAAATAYHRDHPDAEIHLLGGGHWLLETHLHDVVPLVRDFLTRLDSVSRGDHGSPISPRCARNTSRPSAKW